MYPNFNETNILIIEIEKKIHKLIYRNSVYNFLDFYV